MWQAEFDYALAHYPDGVFTLTMHPQVIGRGSRMMMLERLIGHMRSRPGAVFRTMGDVAAAWRQRHPFEP